MGDPGSKTTSMVDGGHEVSADTGPALPPQLESARSQTVEQLTHDLAKLPLFMTSLDDAGTNEEENPELEAIKALQYEGSPYENALNFKEQGNELVHIKQWSDARQYYSKAIAALSQEVQPSEDSRRSEASDDPAQKAKLREACLVNRALCNLTLKNYRSTYLDCQAALELNPRNVKACYRAGQALYALDRIANALEISRYGIKLDSGNKEMQLLIEKLQQREQDLQRRQRLKDDEADRLRRSKGTLLTALRSRGIRSLRTDQPPNIEDMRLFLSPDETDVESTLHMPISIVYATEEQFDLIKAVPETDTIKQHLQYILPERWPDRPEFALSNIEIYMQTSKGGLVKIGKNLPIGKVLRDADVEIVDEMLQIMVVPKQKAEDFIKKFKANKTSQP